MIIIKIHGGLGNQMFQYAFGRNLSLLHNTPFMIDSSYLRGANQSERSLVLQNFNTILSEATLEEIHKYCGTFQKILDRLRPESKRRKILENPDIFDQNILKRTDGYFDGYWNDEKYFRENWNTIQKDFTLKNPFGSKALETAQLIESQPNAVNLHIRRGDYVSISKIANMYTSLPFSYYENAMNKILKAYPDAHFFISSDDISWVKENFPKNYPATFLSSKEIPDYEELILMSLCKHNIIANSTFSWWGAYLNQNQNKIVVAPKNWFKDESKNLNPIILPTWIQM